jgi:hypothetical protein
MGRRSTSDEHRNEGRPSNIWIGAASKFVFSLLKQFEFPAPAYFVLGLPDDHPFANFGHSENVIRSEPNYRRLQTGGRHLSGVTGVSS